VCEAISLEECSGKETLGGCIFFCETYSFGEENCVDLLSPKGMAISFCNGVGNLETVASIVGDHRAAAAVTYEALQRVDTRQVGMICTWFCVSKIIS